MLNRLLQPRPDPSCTMRHDGRQPAVLSSKGSILPNSGPHHVLAQVFTQPTVKPRPWLKKGFDALIAHTTIVMTRYIFLSIEKRRTEDPRTLGLLFHRCCEEAEDCTLVKALCQILDITLENLKKLGDNQSQAERIRLEAFQEGMRSLGRNFDYIFNEQRLLAANG